MKKFLPAIFLLISPYVFLIAAILCVALERGLSVTALSIILITFGAVVLIIFIPNIIYALRLLTKGEESENLLFWNFVLKMFHIPFFIAMYISGLLLAMMIIFTFPLIIIIAIIDYSLLFATSVYGIAGIIRTKKEGQISLFATILHIGMHLCFVLDIISAIFLYAKRKNSKKELNTGQVKER